MVGESGGRCPRAIMARVRRADTGPEIAVRRLLHGLGYRFRLHRRDLPGTPDLVLPRYGAAVFVHGCFWHGHGVSAGSAADVERGLLVPKLARNVERDSEVRRVLGRMGWRVLTVWECEIGVPGFGERV